MRDVIMGVSETVEIPSCGGINGSTRNEYVSQLSGFLTK